MSAAVHAVCCLLRTWNPLLPASDTVTSLAASLWPTVLIIIYCSSLIGVVVSESRCMRAFSRRGGPSLEGHPQGPVTGVGQGERPQMPAATVTVCSVSALPLPPASGTLSLSAYPLPTTVPVFCCCRQRLILQAWGRGGPSLEGHPQGPVTGVGQGERPQMPAAAVTVCSVSALPLPPASGRASVA